jgi:hypothetical protein
LNVEVLSAIDERRRASPPTSTLTRHTAFESVRRARARRIRRHRALGDRH